MIKKYSPEYWLHHYEYVMGYKKKLDIDKSNEKWTKTGLTKILDGEFPYGWIGENGAIALIEFIKLYHSDKLENIIILMIKYIETLQIKNNKPYRKIYNFYLNVKNEHIQQLKDNKP